MLLFQNRKVWFYLKSQTTFETPVTQTMKRLKVVLKTNHQRIRLKQMFSLIMALTPVRAIKIHLFHHQLNQQAPYKVQTFNFKIKWPVKLAAMALTRITTMDSKTHLFLHHHHQYILNKLMKKRFLIHWFESMNRKSCFLIVWFETTFQNRWFLDHESWFIFRNRNSETE